MAKRLPKLILPELPVTLATLEGIAAWDRWLAHRQELGKRVTAQAARTLLNRVEREGWTPAKWVASVDRSIESGWATVYPPPDFREPAAGVQLVGQRDAAPLHDAAKRAMRADPEWFAHEGVTIEMIQAATTVNDFPAGLRQAIRQAHREAGHRTHLP